MVKVAVRFDVGGDREGQRGIGSVAHVVGDGNVARLRKVAIRSRSSASGLAPH